MLLTISILIAIFGIGLVIFSFTEDWKAGLIAGFLTIVVALVLFGFWVTGTQSGQRAIKTWQSETSGGLERMVEIYDQHGNLLKTYEGKLDVEDTKYGNKVLFDLEGKRVIIYNATVIVEEK